MIFLNSVITPGSFTFFLRFYSIFYMGYHIYANRDKLTSSNLNAFLFLFLPIALAKTTSVE